MLRRAGDIVGSVVLLALLSPLLIVTAAIVLVGMGTPVLFRQYRAGYHGNPFMLYKFRTMREQYSPGGSPLPDAARLTAIGRFLRAASIDELPQFVNVLKGDMSLVGPRPLLPSHQELYTPVQARRQEVRPGITGWAQVNGRNSVSWERKLDMDIWYVDHRSWWLDGRILLLTVVKVLAREGISPGNQSTARPFAGSTLPREDPGEAARAV